MKSIVFRHEYTKELLCNGVKVPWYLGLAYVRFDIMVYVMYPIPLNLLIRWGRDVLFFARRAPSYRESVEKKAYSRGLEDGAKSESIRQDYFYKRLTELL